MVAGSQISGPGRHVAKRVWVAAASLLVALALLAGYREIGASVMRSPDVALRFEASLSGAMPDPLSYAGRRQILLDCVEMMNSVYARVQPASAFLQMAVFCKDEAARSMQSNPHYGFAAYVLARIAALEADWTQFNRMLRISQAGAATEQWISLERLRLYVHHAERLAPETFAARAADIRLLFESPAGISAIAALYRDTAGLRDLIGKEAESLSEEKQARFVEAVRAALQG